MEAQTKTQTAYPDFAVFQRRLAETIAWHEHQASECGTMKPLRSVVLATADLNEDIPAALKYRHDAAEEWRRDIVGALADNRSQVLREMTVDLPSPNELAGGHLHCYYLNQNAA